MKCNSITDICKFFMKKKSSIRDKEPMLPALACSMLDTIVYVIVYLQSYSYTQRNLYLTRDGVN